MRKWLDRKLGISLFKNLRNVDIAFLSKVALYIDDDNIIDFKKLKYDLGYNDSTLSVAKKALVKHGLIRRKDGFFYLTPLYGIKGKDINQELVDLFEDTFEQYGLKITY